MTGPQGAGAFMSSLAILGGSAYDDTLLTLGVVWFSKLALQEEITEWPPLEETLTNDYRNETQKGGYWWTAYFEESGETDFDNGVAIGHCDNIMLFISQLSSVISSDPSGGTITTPGDGYRYHTFTVTGTSDGFWTMDPNPMTVDILLVGGGGGGANTTISGGGAGGGGGAGEVKLLTGVSLQDGGTVHVGVGGNSGNGIRGQNGATTTLSAPTPQTATGGGGGGVPDTLSGAGANGGSGGGGGCGVTGVISGTGGTGSPGGNGGNGAGNASFTNLRAGGGGGAGGNGVSGVAGGQVGNGGPGTSVWGTTYGGGGGGCAGASVAVSGGSGGGGGCSSGGSGISATANTGGGGGGSRGNGAGNGGSGKVVIRYPYP